MGKNGGGMVIWGKGRREEYVGKTEEVYKVGI